MFVCVGVGAGAKKQKLGGGGDPPVGLWGKERQMRNHRARCRCAEQRPPEGRMKFLRGGRRASSSSIHLLCLLGGLG